MSDTRTCPACGQPAPSGVCMGPHAGYWPELQYQGPRRAFVGRIVVTGVPVDLADDDWRVQRRAS